MRMQAPNFKIDLLGTESFQQTTSASSDQIHCLVEFTIFSPSPPFLQAKRRPLTDPLIVHVPDSASALAFLDFDGVGGGGDKARRLLALLGEKLWPGESVLPTCTHSWRFRGLRQRCAVDMYSLRDRGTEWIRERGLYLYEYNLASLICSTSCNIQTCCFCDESVRYALSPRLFSCRNTDNYTTGRLPCFSRCGKYAKLHRVPRLYGCRVPAMPHAFLLH